MSFLAIYRLSSRKQFPSRDEPEQTKPRPQPHPRSLLGPVAGHPENAFSRSALGGPSKVREKMGSAGRSRTGDRRPHGAVLQTNAQGRD